METRKLFLNTVSSVILQLISLVSGFLIPRLIILTYGSETNGMVQSISQFVGLISLMQLGLGAVIQTAFYKPLYHNDNKQISAVYYASRRLFRNIAIYYMIYIFIVMLAYPTIIIDSDDVVGTATLVFILALGLFLQYYWGITNQLLLWANQKGYVYTFLQSIAIIFSTIASVLLMRNNYTIQVVKLFSATSFLIPIVGMAFFVRNNYSITKPSKISLSVIPQRYNATAQHISSITINSIDVILITVILGLTQASVYSVYYMIAYSIRLLVMASSNGVQSLYGHRWSSGSLRSVQNLHRWSVRLFQSASIIIFVPTAVLISDFVAIYTHGVTDVQYNQPLTGIFIVSAQLLYCFQIPQMMLVKAANRYKATQNYFLLEAAVKIIASVIFVFVFGAHGVALGSVVALLMRNTFLRVYAKKFILHDIIFNIKEIILYMSVTAIVVFFNSILKLNASGYLQWAIRSMVVFVFTVIVFIVTATIIFGKQYLLSLVHRS